MLCFTRILSTLGVLVVFLSPQRSQSCGLDIFGVCGAGKALEHAIDNLPPELRDAAEQVLDHLFNKDLPPAIDKLTAAAKALEDRAEKDYEKAINATRIQVEELAEKVVTLAEKFAANRAGMPEDIADCAEWLIGAGFVTGQSITVDGGATMQKR